MAAELCSWIQGMGSDFFLKMWPKHVHAGWKFAYYKTTDHWQVIVNRPPTHNRLFTVNWPPTDQRLTDRSSTNPTTTDHQLTDRFSTDTPTHRVNWPPTTWLNQTYFNRGRLLVVGGLSVVGGFVIRSQNFKEHWNQVSLLF